VGPLCNKMQRSACEIPSRLPQFVPLGSRRSGTLTKRDSTFSLLADSFELEIGRLQVLFLT
jgi:hypothetical protein